MAGPFSAYSKPVTCQMAGIDYTVTTVSGSKILEY